MAGGWIPSLRAAVWISESYSAIVLIDTRSGDGVRDPGYFPDSDGSGSRDFPSDRTRIVHCLLDAPACVLRCLRAFVAEPVHSLPALVLVIGKEDTRIRDSVLDRAGLRGHHNPFRSGRSRESARIVLFDGRCSRERVLASPLVDKTERADIARIRGGGSKIPVHHDSGVVGVSDLF